MLTQAYDANREMLTFLKGIGLHWISQPAADKSTNLFGSHCLAFGIAIGLD